MIRHLLTPDHAPRTARGRADDKGDTRRLRRLERSLAILAPVLVLAVCSAPALATVGLPDGRVYEQVSPTNKHGSEAGATIGGVPPYIVAGVGGNEVAYSGSGPIGQTPTGFDFFSISRRSSDGWHTRGATARGRGKQELFETNPETGLGFSSEMQASVFGAQDIFVPEEQRGSPTPHLYRYDEAGGVQWLGKPTIADPVKLTGGLGADLGELAGASPDYTTIYFAFQGTLTPADDEANPALGNVSRAQEIRTMNASGSPSSNDGFYEWHDGVLESAGILPDGHLDPDGAVPAATLNEQRVTPEQLDNQVSEDGRRAFFVSPDPGGGSGRPPELYVRESTADGGHRTALVSRDPLLPEVGGLPAPAPDGAVAGNGGKSNGEFQSEIGEAYVYASPDGSHAFFESTDRLTPDAPNEGKVMEYEFDTNTDTLSYLPGVADLSSGSVHVLRAARDGSDFAFVRENELELWNGGSIADIGPLESGREIVLTRASSSGSVFVFQTPSPFPAFHFNNGGGGLEQIYRYDVAENELDCISCPPAGILPTGNAQLSHAIPSGEIGDTFYIVTGNRAISEDGTRVFFDTPDRLLAQDTNGRRDVYAWEDGAISLISTGASQLDSIFGDTSPSGNDVFFSTAEGLTPGDADGGYDVYDARVPRPGDQRPPAAVPCEGAVCQGPPSVPQLFTVPASETFEGAGNLSTASPPSAQRPKVLQPKSPTRAQRLARALKACKRQRDAHKRSRCRRQARAKYGVATARVKHKNRVVRQNGRGK